MLGGLCNPFPLFSLFTLIPYFFFFFSFPPLGGSIFLRKWC
ncbi:putative membrane protein [Microcystis aeruginosa TAIHU98]|uniref:Putative membrane protein n=1 Tax=Microcystis aeruginosa TAIHU98 TaxID=1134457 RepID=L7EE10_MICAE|nr:putative membrane protein [Microcystis aeruginosa TAIHU98]